MAMSVYNFSVGRYRAMHFLSSDHSLIVTIRAVVTVRDVPADSKGSLKSRIFAILTECAIRAGKC
jgi:hypothetical protein